ncbi:hypothetical protein E2542_SST01220 [Spatholobus suberectus]|nr:hypothetical protein E2542_SST01220 [Spatholobus suberectus]
MSGHRRSAASHVATARRRRVTLAVLSRGPTVVDASLSGFDTVVHGGDEVKAQRLAEVVYRSVAMRRRHGERWRR